LSNLSNTVFGQVAKAGSKHSSSHSLPHTASSTTAVTAKRTTTSSNAVVIPSKSKIPNQGLKHRHQDAGPSQGFLEEEDENEERNAALSSPIKGGKRLSRAVSYTCLF
jgi:hypothetical protein